jgi:hypothetical protein
MRAIIVLLITLAAVNCTTKVVVVAPTVVTTPPLSAEQRAYVESVATQLARPTETPVPPTSTPVPPTQTPMIVYAPAARLPEPPPAATPPPAAPSAVPQATVSPRGFAVTVTIDGTPGLHFSGIGATRDEAMNGSGRDVVGVTPMTFTVEDARTAAYGPTGFYYSVSVSKGTWGQGADVPGTLSVTLRCPDGDHTKSTSEAYGSVDIQCGCNSDGVCLTD